MGLGTGTSPQPTASSTLQQRRDPPRSSQQHAPGHSSRPPGTLHSATAEQSTLFPRGKPAGFAEVTFLPPTLFSATNCECIYADGEPRWFSEEAD